MNSEGKFKLYIIYNSYMSANHSLTVAYEVGSADMVQDVALYLTNITDEPFQKSKNLSWSQPLAVWCPANLPEFGWKLSIW